MSRLVCRLDTATPKLILGCTLAKDVSTVGRTDRGTQPLGMADRIRLITARQHDQEFLAAITADGVVATH